MDRSGTRGGSLPALTFDEAVVLLDQWRSLEMGWVRARILAIAYNVGEYHADYLSAVDLTQPNVIGAAVGSLTRAGLIEPTGERRKGGNPASHGRRSDVYRITERGRTVAGVLRTQVGDGLPGPRPAGLAVNQTTLDV